MFFFPNSNKDSEAVKIQNEGHRSLSAWQTDRRWNLKIDEDRQIYNNFKLFKILEKASLRRRHSML